MRLSDDIHDLLFAMALRAKTRAVAPYSGFKVGAAVLSKEGNMYPGCNWECSAYGLSRCAEQTALGNAIVAGESTIVAVAVVADVSKPCPPCGACRQLLFEYGPECIVLMSSLGGMIRSSSIRDLLPGAFSADFLPERNRPAWERVSASFEPVRKDEHDE